MRVIWSVRGNVTDGCIGSFVSKKGRETRPDFRFDRLGDIQHEKHD